jgi:hypothetical protein
MTKRRIAFVLGALMLAGFSAPASVHAAPCNSLGIGQGIAFKPFVLSKSQKITLAGGDCAGGAGDFNFTGGNGATLATVRVSHQNGRVDLDFRFNQALAAAEIGAVAVARTQRIELLNLTATKLAADSGKGISTFYPYNWNKAVKRPVRDGDSIIPGFKTGQHFVVYDTPKLGGIAYEAKPGRISAFFPYFTEFNRNGDKARSRMDVRRSERKAMRFYVDVSLARIQDKRFGAPDRRGMQNAEIAQFVPNQWAPVIGSISRRGLIQDARGKHCGGASKARKRTCFATDSEMRAFAAAMPRGNSIAIARIALPLRAAAQAIRDGGASPDYYLFMGAVSTRDGDARQLSNLMLTDSAGKQHLAPYSHKSKGHWHLLDITKKAARDVFIARAVEALKNGYEGIFMDGAFLWNIPNGHVGGDNPNAVISHNHARHILLRDMKAAMRAVNPRARLGLLANRYMEYMHYADYVVREGTSIRWNNVRAAPHLRTVRYDPRGKAQKGWQARYGRLATTPVFFACKGPSPVLVRSCRQSIDVPHDGFYYDSGDWDIHNSEIAGGLVDAIYRKGGVYVTRTDGNMPLIGVGVSQIKFEDQAARIWFSRAAPLLRVKNWRALSEVSHTYQLAANETYIPADMDGAGGWRWAAEGFAYLNQSAYIAGDFYITAPPVVPGPGIAQFQIAAAPRVEAAQETRRGIKDKPGDTRMTVWIYTPNGSNFRLEDLAGKSIRAHSTKNVSEYTVVEIEAADTVVMTISGL